MAASGAEAPQEEEASAPAGQAELPGAVAVAEEPNEEDFSAPADLAEMPDAVAVVEELAAKKKPVALIRPYCGASLAAIYPVEDDRIGDGRLHGRPVPAWTDVGMASHMRDICGLRKTRTMPEVLTLRFSLRVCAFRVFLIGSSLLENLFCWLTYMEIRHPGLNFYNKFEAYSLGAPGYDRALAVTAALNSGYLFFFWVFVSVLRCENHRALGCGRLVLSLASGVCCTMAVFFSESTKVFPFACTLCSLLHLQALTLAGLLHDQGRPLTASKRKLTYAIFVALWFFAVCWCCMFLFDGMAFLREDACRATKNRAMPVRVQGVLRWQCVRWGETHYIKRLPPADSSVLEAQCDTAFHVFDAPVSVAGGVDWTPSRRAHWVECPPSCQSFGLAKEVVGCRVWDARSSMCAAAVQMGVVNADTGGLVKIVGRDPPLAYDRCNLNGVASIREASGLAGADLLASRSASSAAQTAGDGSTDSSGSYDANASNGTDDADASGADEVAPPRNITLLGAFYFQEVAGMERDDFVTLHGFRRVSFPGPKKPYASYVADVSWSVGGAETQRREVPIGPAPSSDMELNFCHAAGNAPNVCE